MTHIPFPHRFQMNFRRRAEYVIVRVVIGLFGLLPLDIASGVGGFLARLLGPFTRLHSHAKANLKLVLPDMAGDGHTKILTAMWDNLGRTMAEYPHIARIAQERIEFDNRADISFETLRESPALFISGHFANWEIAGPSLLHVTGIRLNLLYRAANNRAVDRLLNTYRSMGGRLHTIPKSRGGMRQLLALLKQNEKIGILIDQKYNEGQSVPFFGVPATSSDSYVQIAQKINCPVFPAQIIRARGACFKIILYPSLTLFLPDGTPREAADVVRDAHTLLENWMRAAPEQWLWVHRRWGKIT